MNIFQWLSIGIKWGPHVISAVYLIESLFGSGMSGPEKKEAVMAWLKQQQEKLNLPWGTQAITVISNMIDTVVGILNLLGVFRHTDNMTPEELASGDAAAETVNSQGVHDVVNSDSELAAFIAKTEH